MHDCFIYDKLMTTPAPKFPLDILQKRQNLEKHDTRPKRKTAVFNGGSFSLAQLKIMPAARPGQEKTGTCFFFSCRLIWQ